MAKRRAAGDAVNTLAVDALRREKSWRWEPQSHYKALILKAWDKGTLAIAITKALEPYEPQQIIKVEMGVDFQFFLPWRRNWALIVVEDEETAQ
jgi:hypothetical protein